MKKILLIGAGGHSKSCIDVIELQKKYRIVGLIANKKEKEIFGYKDLGKDNLLNKLSSEISFALVTVGQIENYKIREKLFKKASNLGFKFPQIISPIAYVSKHAKIGNGTIIMHGAVVNAGAKVGKNCIINSKSLIEHDVQVGDNCHISTRATLNGGVIIKKNSFIGSSSVIRQNITIGEKCFINSNIFINKNLNNGKKIYKQ